MKIDTVDFYQNDERNIPSLEIEYTDSEGTHTVISNNVEGEISRQFTIHVIKSPLYAKSTGRSMGNYATHTAELSIRDIEICDVTIKAEVAYKYADFKRKFGKDTPNLKDFLSLEEGLQFIVEHKASLNKCMSQRRIRALLYNDASINEVKENRVIGPIITDLMERFGITDEVSAKYVVQIVEIIEEQGINSIQKALKWVCYKQIKNNVDKRLKEFDTTKLSLHTTQKSGKLMLSFGRAGRMSNGERDLLSFIASLIVFESSLGRKPGILIIDEVFDYLDGANLLAVQYYLSQMIKEMKNKGKQIFPIIMTHLDPAVFGNYSLKGMAVHYLTNKSKIDLDDNIVKMLQLRSTLQDTDKADFEKYLLHYHPDNWEIPNEIKGQLPENFFPDSRSLREWLYKEVEEKYLGRQDYNALAVIIALRMKVEEKTVAMLPEENRCDYYNQHGSKNKLLHAESLGVDLPELFYLLQPLYKDPAHLRNGQEKENRNKIESAYLKVSSEVVRQMISKVFCE